MQRSSRNLQKLPNSGYDIMASNQPPKILKTNEGWVDKVILKEVHAPLKEIPVDQIKSENTGLDALNWHLGFEPQFVCYTLHDVTCVKKSALCTYTLKPDRYNPPAPQKPSPTHPHLKTHQHLLLLLPPHHWPSRNPCHGPTAPLFNFRCYTVECDYIQDYCRRRPIHRLHLGLFNAHSFYSTSGAG